MKWTVTLAAETESGDGGEQPVAYLERGEVITPASLGLSIAEGKTILAAIQTAMVTAQVQQHGESLRPCSYCARRRPTKGYYSSSVLSTRHNPIAPELLTAKLAALMPFGKVAAFLDEMLPTSSRTHGSTVRNRTLRVGKRLERHHDALLTPGTRAPAARVVLGLDGEYVRNRYPRPERTFEIVAGKILSDDNYMTRFAFVREGGPDGGGRRQAAAPSPRHGRRYPCHRALRRRRAVAG